MESYLPNNPSFGQQDPWKSPPHHSLQGLSPISQSEFDVSPVSKLCPQDFETSPRSPVDLNMNSFSFSPVDIDPFTSFLSLSSCSSPYKDYAPFKEVKGHDPGDVLLSLKHTLHPSTTVTQQSQQPQQLSGQLSPLSSLAHAHYNQSIGLSTSLGSQMTQNYVAPTTVPGSTVSYNAYPQIQVSGTNSMAPPVSVGSVFYPGDFSASTASNPTHASAVFPAAMSVNLSMNMTMGVPNFNEQFIGTASVGPQPQVQWTASAAPGAQYSPTAPAAAVQAYAQPVQVSYNPPSPTYATGATAGTYTFTAEFRPAEGLTLPPIEREFSGCGAALKPMPTVFYPCKQVAAAAAAAAAAASAPPIDNLQTQNMFKPKPRTIPTGRAACFPAGVAPETPPPPLQQTHSSPTLTDNCDSAGGTKTNLCRICGKTYARPSTLKTHMRTHSGERPYRCGTCNKSFSQAANLTAHIRTHSGEKPFRCPVCDRRFSQSSSVTTHMRTHSGERPYRCCMCKKAFSDSSTLTKHLRIHSGEKPYQCKLCLLRFSQSGNLNRHMRVHVNST